MYKIYNNEIKIKQILRGGGIYDETIGGAFGNSSSFNPHPIESQIYKSNNDTTLEIKEDVLKKENGTNLLRPLYGTEIRYTNFDVDMYVAILYTLILFDGLYKGIDHDVASTTYIYRLGNNDENFEKDGSVAYDSSIKEVVNASKNYFTLGIAVLKQLGLYDHETDDFVDFDDFKDKVIGKPSSWTKNLSNTDDDATRKNNYKSLDNKESKI